MIVKDERDVICRCLESVKPLIDYWVIIDTGSTDGTQELIKTFMKDIPGELHERPWVDFAFCRNQALELAKEKANYLLFIDADEIYEVSKDFIWPVLEKDAYYISCEFNGTLYQRLELIKADLDWKWKGVLHEYLDAAQVKSASLIGGIKNIVYTDGARSKDPGKYLKDAEVLEKALQEEPENQRYRFYLAQSYKDAGRYEEALLNYKKRVSMEGWDQEVFWSLLQVGILEEMLHSSPEAIIGSYISAYFFRPSRAESLYYLASYYRKNGDFFSGYLAAKRGIYLPMSKDALFVTAWIYDYGLLLEYSICAYWIGKYAEAKWASDYILGKAIPQKIRKCVESNLLYINEAISQ